MNKQNFINNLTRLSHEEINLIIKENGKQPRNIKLFVKIEDLKQTQKKL